MNLPRRIPIAAFLNLACRKAVVVGLAFCFLMGCSRPPEKPYIVGKRDPVAVGQKPKVAPDPVPEIPPLMHFEMGVGQDDREKSLDTLCLSRDGKRVAVSNVGSGSGEKFTGKIQIWDIAEKPKKVKEYGGRLLAMSPDGTRIVCRQSRDWNPRILDVETNKEIAQIDDFLGQLKYQSNDVIWLLPIPWHPNTAPNPVMVFKYDGNTGKQIGKYLVDKEQKGHFARPVKDDRNFYFVTNSGRVVVWDSTTQKTKRDIPLVFKAGGTFHLDGASYAFDSDGKWMVSTITVPGNNGRVARFDLSAGAVAKEINANAASRSFHFIPNTSVFLGSQWAGLDKSDVFAYDIATEKVVGRFLGAESQYPRIHLSANGSVMAAESMNGKVQIWDLQRLKSR